MRLPWVLLASVAFKNINQQLQNQFTQLNFAILSLALNTFSIDDFFPTKDQLFDLQNGLAGLGGILSILGGFVPVFGSSISAAGTIAAGVGTFLANSAAASGDPMQPQKTFAEDVLTFYVATLAAMDKAVNMLFEGKSIPPAGPNSFNITDMMKDGAWVNTNSLTSVSDLNQKIRIETLARSIDSLWKTRPTNKMWVLFFDLQDDKNSTQCAQDNTGPPDSKYCADGGVYYTYNFIERPNGGGGVGWPWGADKLRPKAQIELKWVTEASARTYRLAKKMGRDPFNYNQTLGISDFLINAFSPGEDRQDLSEDFGRFPGSWTLPVCDASTWGKAWNWDYTGEDNKIRESGVTHPPCMCDQASRLTDICELGPLALETYDWAKAAGLSGFETFWHRCKKALTTTRPLFEWPENVTFIDYPTNDGDEVHKIEKP
ncbi:MAG: hypothetical protein Q9172_007668 [Xanthocarpia lactea]